MSAADLAKAAGAWALWNSAGAAVVVVLVLGVQSLLGARVSARWRHNLWLLVVVRLMLPALPAVRVHLPAWAKASVVEKASPAAPVALPDLKPASVSSAPGPDVPPAPYVPPAASTSANEIATAPPVTADIPLEPLAVFVEAEPVQSALRAPGPLDRRFVPVAAAPRRMPAIQLAPQPAPRPGARPVDRMLWVALVWLAGAAALLLRLMWTSVQLWRGTRRLKPVTDPLVTQLVAECACAFGIKRPPAILAAASDSSPALVGVFRPKLLLPPCVLGDFGLAGLRLIVLHELAHLKRRDVATNYLLSVLGAVHWFNPLVWVAFARLRAERELACDEAVLRASGAPAGREYGQTILKLIESLSRGGGVPAGALGAVQHKVLMHRRMTMIAKFDPTRRGRSVAGAVLSLVVGGAMLATAVRAQDAQLPPSDKPATSPRSVGEARRAIDTAAGGGGGPTTPADPLTPPAPLARPSAATVAPSAAPAPFASPATPAPTPQLIPPAPANRPGGAVLPPPLTPSPKTATRVPARGAVRTVDDPAAAQANATTAEKLRKPATPTFENIPLRDCLNYFADEGKLDIVTDNRALDSAQSMDQPVTMRIREPRPLDQVLQLALRMAGPELDYALVNGVVFISTRAELSRHIVTRAYEPGDADRSALDRAIGIATGGGAEIVVVDNKLFVTASEPDQREIAKLLAIVPGPSGGQRRTFRQTSAAEGAQDKVTNILPLKYADAREVATLVAKTIGPAVTVAPDPRTNSLVVAGPASQVNTALTLVNRLDQPGKDGQSSLPGNTPEKAQAALANMRTLIERLTEANEKFDPSRPENQNIARKIELYGTELDRLASTLSKEGKDAEAAAIRDEMQKLKALLEPFSRDLNLLRSPATTAR